MHKNPRFGIMIKYAPVCDIRCLKKYVSRRRTSKVSQINRSSETVGIKRWKGKDKSDKSVTDLSSTEENIGTRIFYCRVCELMELGQ